MWEITRDKACTLVIYMNGATKFYKTGADGRVSSRLRRQEPDIWAVTRTKRGTTLQLFNTRGDHGKVGL